jgi:undecaprenyl-diphosphatase
MTLFEAIVLAVVEGLTEFLPVSSTGHMIVAAALMGMDHTRFVVVFTVAIQLGAIMAVVALYWKRFLQNLQFYRLLVVAFVPAALAGLFLKKHIEMMLTNVPLVGAMLLLGGVVFLFIDRWVPGADPARAATPMTYRRAFTIGVWQCLAMVPGVSRSAATIIGGMTQGLSRTHAAEFSFFLAVPTMLGATAKSLLDFHQDGGVFTPDDWKLLAVGILVAFVVAAIAIKGFIAFLTRRGFRLFGWYRIAIGGIIVLLYLLGVPMAII